MMHHVASKIKKNTFTRTHKENSDKAIDIMRLQLETTTEFMNKCHETTVNYY